MALDWRIDSSRSGRDMGSVNIIKALWEELEDEQIGEGMKRAVKR